MSIPAGRMTGSHARRNFGPGILVLPLMLAGSLLLGRMATEPQLLRVALLGAIVLLVAGVTFFAPTKTLLALMIWLAALGFLRRVVSGYAPAGGNDPLLLVEPLILALLVAVAVGRGAFRQRSSLSNAVAVLTLLVLLGALNPLQGSVVAGVAGLLFILVPMLGFWVGRGLCDDETMRRLLKLVGGMALVAGLYGLGQTFIGLPSWDFNWVWEARDRGYDALFVYSAGGGPGAIRPFAMFASASEYVVYVAVGIVVWIAFWQRTPRAPLALASLGVLIVALLYGSSRGSVVSLVAALVLMRGAWKGRQLSVSLVTTAGILLLVPLAAGVVVPDSVGTSGPGSLIAHQLEGLRDPLDPKASTAGAHADLVIGGVRSAISEPLGVGVGSISIASSRFGGVQKATEADPSNVAVALGLPGLVAYLAVLAVAFRRGYLVALRRRDRLALAALGILGVTAFQWLAGGNYAVAILPWLVLGWLDRSSVADESTSPEPA